jgi:hypothetical protein
MYLYGLLQAKGTHKRGRGGTLQSVGSGQGGSWLAGHHFFPHFDLHLAGNPYAFQTSNYTILISLAFHVFSSNLSLVFKRGLFFLFNFILLFKHGYFGTINHR